MLSASRAIRCLRYAFFIWKKLSRFVSDSMTAFGAQNAFLHRLTPFLGTKITQESLDAWIALFVPQEIDVGELVGNHGTEELHHEVLVQFSLAPSKAGHVDSFYHHRIAQRFKSWALDILTIS